MNNSNKTWLQLLLSELGKNSLSVVFIAIMYLMLYIVPQINDLIMVVIQAEGLAHWYVVPIFFIVLSVFAFLISKVNVYINPILNIPESIKKKLSDEEIEKHVKSQSSFFSPPDDEKDIYVKFKNKKDNEINEGDYIETRESYMAHMLPRILGTILILITAFSVNNTSQQVYENGELIFGGNWTLLALIILLLLFTNKSVVDVIDSIKFLKPILKLKQIPFIIVALSLVLILYFGFENQGGSLKDTKNFFYSLLLLALVFVILRTSSSKSVTAINSGPAKFINALTAIILLGYIILFISPSSLKFVEPLTIVFICMVGVYTILNIVRYFAARYKWFPSLPTFLIILAILAIRTTESKNFSHYDASHVSTTIKVEDRMLLDEYINQWISDRRQEILNSSEEDPFPIILVSSEGGGSRAGLWTFLVQSYLFDKDKDYFEKYLFSLSGASGGGVGNNMFYTQAYELLENPSATPLKLTEKNKDSLLYRASLVYNNDYLSSSVAGLLGRDSFLSITGLPLGFDDRGKILENEWEKEYANVFNRTKEGSLGAAYLDIMPKKGDHKYIRPIVITSVTHLQSGQRYIISPVNVEKDSFNMNVFPDLLKKYQKIHPGQMIKRSTAMSMNARFPYLSPVARIDSVGQFGDAGYYNNIGGSVSLRLQVALERELAKDSLLNGKYDIRQLSVTNYVNPPDSTNYSSQLMAPVGMISKASFAHPKESVASFNNIDSIQSKQTAIYITSDEEIKPFIPLGRYLSKTAVRSMEQRLFEIQKKVDSVIMRKR